MAKTHLRLFLLRWHRRLGIVSALFVLLLAATGLLLNHTHELGLDRLPLENSLLRRLYGVAPAAEAAEAAAPALAQALPGGELTARGGRLRMGERDIGDCPRLVGIVEQGGQVLAVCSNRLWLLTPDGQVIDQADSVRGVPEGLSAVAEGEGQVLLRAGDDSLAVDLSDLSLRPAVPVPGVAWREAAPAADPDLDWEQVLLDLHSGRLFGRAGVILMDAMAILFMILAVSGLVMWRRRHRPT
ncbi:MAG TPA: PepSY domain-containing protein [Moraxellaceae bacterium]|nr:PepSY domain-containing protein [Moraxellaceae bacterium]